MMVVGITGGIASGKSTVTKILIEKGFPVCDADILARLAMDDPDILKQVCDNFDCFEDGVLNRKKLGRIIFGDESKKALLESIIHPYVIEKMQEFVVDHQDAKVVFLDIPLLFESNLEYLCDKIVVVALDQNIQLARLQDRDGIDRDYALKIIENQIPLADKIARADIVIDNSFDRAALERRIDEVIEEIWNY